MINTKSAITTFVSAMCVSLAPVPTKSINSQIFSGIKNIAQEQNFHDTLSGVVYLPISEATQFLREDANKVRKILAKSIAMREKRGGGLLFTMEFYPMVKKIIKER